MKHLLDVMRGAGYAQFGTVVSLINTCRLEMHQHMLSCYITIFGSVKFHHIVCSNSGVCFSYLTWCIHLLLEVRSRVISCCIKKGIAELV